MTEETGIPAQESDATQLDEKLARRAKWSLVSSLLSVLIAAFAIAPVAFDGALGYWRSIKPARFSGLVILSLIFAVEAIIMGSDGRRCEGKWNRRLAGAGIAIGGVIAVIALGHLLYLTFADLPLVGVCMLAILLVILWLLAKISNLRFNILVDPGASLDEVDREALDDRLGHRAKWSVVVAVLAVLLLVIAFGLASLRAYSSAWIPEIPNPISKTLVGVLSFCALLAGLAAARLGADTTQRPEAYGGCLAWAGMLLGLLAFLAGFLALGLVAGSKWVLGVLFLSIATVLVVERINKKQRKAGERASAGSDHADDV